MDAEVFYVLLGIGIIFICAEVFVPGGVLGSIGALALVGAIVMAFRAFPERGAYVAFAVFFGFIISLVVWIRVFPHTGIGKRMTVSKDLHESRATQNGLDALTGLEGVAASELRPAGFAMIEGKRIDVVTQGELIPKNETIRVIEVEGNRVVVARAHDTASQDSKTDTASVS